MARPSKTTKIDYKVAHELTYGLLDRAICPNDLSFVLVRDSDKKGLRLRVTKAGGKHWQFETRIKGKLLTRSLGEWPAVSIEAARAEAHRLRGLTETGTDPRELDRMKAKEKAAAIAAAAARDEAYKRASFTVGEVWAMYLEERKPHWGELHYKDHVKLARAGGRVMKRGTDGRGVTIDMPLHAFMGMKLRDLTAPVVEAWAAREGKTRPTSARLAWRLLKGFLGWCSEQPAYAGLVTGNAAKTKRSREAFGKPAVKQDALLREQLPAWFSAVQRIQNPIIAAALQVMLLTGARPGEVLTLRWKDLNVKWRGLTIRDKVEGVRVIPLTPYVHYLIAALPRRNELIFSSTTAEAGALTAPRKHHVAACTVAGIDNLTLHGLRRSFKSLTEWLEIPAGVVAQLMGHKPSATAEKHYTVRPLDLLRVHHERIEAWILAQAGIVFDAKTERSSIRVVTGT